MSAQFITACLMSFPAVFAVASCLIWECSMVNKLKEQSKALLFFSHDSDEIIFEELRKYGKIEPIYNRQQIRMYTYSRNSSEKGA